MITRRKEIRTQSNGYQDGIREYRRGRCEQALRLLEGLAGGQDLRGRIARFYCGLAHRQLGLAALRQGDFASAERRLRAAVDRIGRWADLASHLASLYAQTGQHDACVTQASIAADAQPTAASAQRALALAQWRAGRRTEAHQTLTAALRRLPGDAQLTMQLGLFHAAEEKLDEARRLLSDAAAADSANAEAQHHLGLVCAAQGDAAGACRRFQRALELRGEDLLIAWQLSLAARAATEAGAKVAIRLPELSPPVDATRARDLAGFLAAEPDFVDAMLSLPESDADADLFGVLAAALDAALAEHPRYADLHCRACRVLTRLGRTDHAAAHARRALAINPRYATAMLALAHLEDRAGRSDQAAALLRRAVECGADWPDVHCRAGEMLARLGRTRDARRHLERALELKADYPRAAEAMKALAA